MLEKLFPLKCPHCNHEFDAGNEDNLNGCPRCGAILCPECNLHVKPPKCPM